MSVTQDHAADVGSLAQFTQNPQTFLQQVRDTGRPIVLEENGEPALVVQDAAAYQRMLEQIDRTEAIEGIQRGLCEMQDGLGEPAEKVFEELGNEFGLPIVR